MPVPWCPDTRSVPRSWTLTDNRPFLQPKPEKHTQVRKLTDLKQQSHYSKDGIGIKTWGRKFTDLKHWQKNGNKKLSQDLQSNSFLFLRDFLTDLHVFGDFMPTEQWFLL